MSQQKENQTKMDFEQKRWDRHNTVERGNAEHVFAGMSFKLKK